MSILPDRMLRRLPDVLAHGQGPVPHVRRPPSGGPLRADRADAGRRRPRGAPVCGLGPRTDRPASDQCSHGQAMYPRSTSASCGRTTSTGSRSTATGRRSTRGARPAPRAAATPTSSRAASTQARRLPSCAARTPRSPGRCSRTLTGRMPCIGAAQPADDRQGRAQGGARHRAATGGQGPRVEAGCNRRGPLLTPPRSLAIRPLHPTPSWLAALLAHRPRGLSMRTTRAATRTGCASRAPTAPR